MPISARTEWDLLSKTNHLNKQQIVLYKHIEEHIQTHSMRISKSTQKQKRVTSTSIQLPPQDPSVIRGVFTIGLLQQVQNKSLQEGENPLLQVKLCEQGKRCDQDHLLHSAHHNNLPGRESELKIFHPTSKWTLKPFFRIIQSNNSLKQ